MFTTLFYWDPHNLKCLINYTYFSQKTLIPITQTLTTQGRLPLYSSYTKRGTIIVKPRNMLLVTDLGLSKLNSIAKYLSIHINPNKQALCDVNLYEDYPELFI